MEFGKRKFGNYTVTKFEKEGVPYLRIAPVSNQMSWEYSAFEMMYNMIESAVDNNQDKALEMVFSTMDGFLHAKEMVVYDLFVAFMSKYAEIVEPNPPMTREEEREYIDQAAAAFDMQKELEKYQKKE